VTCTTDADAGDVDLYMNRNGEIDSYDCFSNSVESSLESCTISAGLERRVYAILQGFVAETFNCTVTCTISTNGVKSAEFSLGEGEYKSFFISVPSSSIDLVTCTTDADNVDLDLYMNRNGEIDKTADCNSLSPADTSLEACTINANPGSVYAIIFGYNETSDFTVTCTSSPSIELTDGVNSTEFSVGYNEVKSFFIIVPSSSNVTCTTDADNGDLDLLMNRDGNVVGSLDLILIR
jgi:hypothetical protein